MTLSLVAVVTDVIRDGKPVVGYGFNSNGRYGQGKLMRERFIPRVLEAAPDSLIDASGKNLDPHKIWNTMFTNEKPGGHGERSVAIGTIDMAVWDAVAKIEGKPLFQLLADRYGDGKPNRKIFVYAAGGYYYPGQDHEKLKDEMRSYIDRGYTRGQEEDRRCVAGRRPAPHRFDPERAAGRPEAVRRRQRPLRPGHRDRLRQGAVAVRPVLVRGAGRPARLRAAGHAAQLLQEPDGDRRRPVLDAGRAQPDPLRRHAPGPRLAAVRLRPELRPGRVPAHAGHAQGARLVRRAAASRTAATRCR